MSSERLYTERQTFAEPPQDLTLISVIKDLLADISELFRTEVRLAKAEMIQSAKQGLKAGVWLAVAAGVGMIAGLVLLEAIIFGLAALGLGLFFASLIVALVLFAIAAIAFYYGQSLARVSMTPERTVGQVNKDIAVVREQIS